MKKIKIGFSRGNTLFSSLIAFIEGWECSHTYINFYSESLKRDIIYHANPYGVGFINKENFLKHSTIVYEFEIDVSDESYRNMMRWCVDNSGDIRYSFKGLLGKLLIKLKLSNKNIFSDGIKTVDCNELVQYVLKELDIDIDLDPEKVGPKALYEYLEFNDISQLL